MPATQVREHTHDTEPTHVGTGTTDRPDTPDTGRAAGTAGQRSPDGMAVASFVLGLTGLLVFNLLLGPCALVLGGIALARGTARRARALAGVLLGAADLVVLAVVVASSHAMSWSLTG